MQHLWSLASRFGSIPVIANTFLWRIEFWYLAGIALRREVYLKRLLQSVGGVLVRKGITFSSITSGVAASPGYDCEDGKRFSGICWEAPVIIVISVDNAPAFGMGVEFRGPHLYIRQLQGVKGVALPASLQKWPQLLVEGAMTFVLNNEEIESVCICAADQRLSYWAMSDEMGKLVNDPVLMLEHQKRLRRRYDGTARQMGFVRHKSGRYWSWTLSQCKKPNLQEVVP